MAQQTARSVLNRSFLALHRRDIRKRENFYSRQEGQLDYSAATSIVVEEGERTLDRIDQINKVVSDPKLEQARKKLESAVSLDPDEADTEKSQEAMEQALEARLNPPNLTKNKG